MPFAAGLRDSLQFRQSQVPAEFTNGEDLQQVLSRHLLAVEAMAEGELITSVLLLSADGCLSHGAAPGLPQSYCDAVDGSQIGPCAGSCGTAAYLGRPIYVSDIATDALWADYRHLALPHGLKSCWSTPIRDSEEEVIGTFAIYRRTIGHPTRDEIEAIDMITEHVADAIVLARNFRDSDPPPPPPPPARHERPQLRLVVDHECLPELPADRRDRLLNLIAVLESKAAKLDSIADRAESRETSEKLKATAELSRKLVAIIRCRIDGDGRHRGN